MNSSFKIKNSNFKTVLKNMSKLVREGRGWQRRPLAKFKGRRSQRRLLNIKNSQWPSFTTTAIKPSFRFLFLVCPNHHFPFSILFQTPPYHVKKQKKGNQYLRMWLSAVFYLSKPPLQRTKESCFERRTEEDMEIWRGEERKDSLSMGKRG